MRQDKYFDCLIIGAGFGGLTMLHECRKRNLTARVLERGTDIGGTWYWNRYPGARSDSESWSYVFFFDKALYQDFDFQERFATQEHSHRFMSMAADRLDMRKDIQLKACVTAASFDEERSIWTVEIDGGEILTCKYLVSASGALTEFFKPDFENADSFAGETYATGQWPKHEVSYEGKRVAVIGTGASAVQVIPIVAHTAKSLTVFQRTANFVFPGRNYPITRDQQREINANFESTYEQCLKQVFAFPMVDSTTPHDALSPEEQRKVLDKGWEDGGFHFLFETFNDLLTSRESNDLATEYIRNKIRAIVKDPETAERLCPKHVLFAKRPPLGHFYYETFNRDNVRLVDVSEAPIEEITPTGLKTAEEAFDFDMIIYATGFDALTGALSKMNIRGREGKSLNQAWAKGARTQLGIAVDGFPNFFMISGPQGPFANYPMVIDQATKWIGQAMSRLEESDDETMEATPEAVDQWCATCKAIVDATVLKEGYGTRAWFLGTNIPGKPASVLYYFAGAPAYFGALRENIDQGFAGFEFKQTALA